MNLKQLVTTLVVIVANLAIFLWQPYISHIAVYGKYYSSSQANVSGWITASDAIIVAITFIGIAVILYLGRCDKVGNRKSSIERVES